MIREILVYPNKKLYEKSTPVSDFNEDLHELLDDMYETMLSQSGIGLAGIQIGVAKNILIINLVSEETGEQRKEDLMEVINPKITKKSGETIFNEGCLSVPGYFEEIKRFEFISVEYQDRFGNLIKKDLEGLSSIAFQHEMDHLLGHLFIEKLNYRQRKRFDKEFKKNQRS